MHRTVRGEPVEPPTPCTLTPHLTADRSHICYFAVVPSSTQDDCKVGQDGLLREGDERWECVDMSAEESLFQCLEQVPDPRRARGVRHPF